MLPLDGLARLTSAITATSWPLSAAMTSRPEEEALLAISLSRSSGVCRWRTASSARTLSRISLSTLTRFCYPLGSDALLPVMVARPLRAAGRHPPAGQPAACSPNVSPAASPKPTSPRSWPGTRPGTPREAPRHRGMRQGPGADDRDQRAADITGDQDPGHAVDEERGLKAHRHQPRRPGAGPDQQREQAERGHQPKGDEDGGQVAAA